MNDGLMNKPESAAFIPMDDLPYTSAIVDPDIERERVSTIWFGSTPFLSSSFWICAIAGNWHNKMKQNVQVTRGRIQTVRNFFILIEDSENSEQDDDIS